jgi:hypothetical protein
VAAVSDLKNYTYGVQAPSPAVLRVLRFSN